MHQFSLTHQAQRLSRLAFSWPVSQEPEKTRNFADRFRADAHKDIQHANLYMFTPTDASTVRQWAEQYTKEDAEGFFTSAKSALSDLEKPLSIEIEGSSASVIVAPNHIANFRAPRDWSSLYFLAGGRLITGRAHDNTVFLQPFFSSLDQNAKAFSGALYSVFFTNRIDKDKQGPVIQFAVFAALACTLALQRKIVVPASTQAYHSGGATHGYRLRPYSPLKTVRIHPDFMAVIERQQQARQRIAEVAEAAKTRDRYAYDRPFIVKKHDKPSLNITVPEHAKGGTPEERDILNEFIAAREEAVARSDAKGEREAKALIQGALIAFESPQAPELHRVTIASARHRTSTPVNRRSPEAGPEAREAARPQAG